MNISNCTTHLFDYPLLLGVSTYLVISIYFFVFAYWHVFCCCRTGKLCKFRTVSDSIANGNTVGARIFNCLMGISCIIVLCTLLEEWETNKVYKDEKSIWIVLECLATCIGFGVPFVPNKIYGTKKGEYEMIHSGSLPAKSGEYVVDKCRKYNCCQLPCYACIHYISVILGVIVGCIANARFAFGKNRVCLKLPYVIGFFVSLGLIKMFVLLFWTGTYKKKNQKVENLFKGATYFFEFLAFYSVLTLIYVGSLIRNREFIVRCVFCSDTS